METLAYLAGSAAGRSGGDGKASGRADSFWSGADRNVGPGLSFSFPFVSCTNSVPALPATYPSLYPLNPFT